MISHLSAPRSTASTISSGCTPACRSKPSMSPLTWDEYRSPHFEHGISSSTAWTAGSLIGVFLLSWLVSALGRSRTSVGVFTFTVAGSPVADGIAVALAAPTRPTRARPAVRGEVGQRRPPAALRANLLAIARGLGVISESAVGCQHLRKTFLPATGSGERTALLKKLAPPLPYLRARASRGLPKGIRVPPLLSLMSSRPRGTRARHCAG